MPTTINLEPWIYGSLVHVILEGEYKGKSIREVIDIDPSYIQNLIESDLYVPSSTASALLKHSLIIMEAWFFDNTVIEQDELYNTES